MLGLRCVAAAVSVGLVAGAVLMLLVNQRDHRRPLESIERFETGDTVFARAAPSKDAAAAG